MGKKKFSVRQYDRDILYHYTDFQALDGILDCAELRLNNVLNMNDAAEMRHFMSRLCSAVVQRLERENNFWDAEKARELFKKEIKREFFYSAYAACFSLYRDDAAQWERYGNRGRGVCVAFQGEHLGKLAGGDLSLQTVFYQDDMTEHGLVDVFCHLIENEAGHLEENSSIKEAMNDAWVQSVVYKHPSFSSENEVRLVFSPFKKQDAKPRYHVSAERIKKYYALDLKAMCQEAGIGMEDLIVEIIIGPESTQSLSILQDYLKDQGLPGLANKVSLSDCPLRRLPV